jgi:hypothetical protein
MCWGDRCMFRAASQVLLTRPAYFQTITDIKKRRTKRLQPVLLPNLSPRGRFWALGLLYFPLLSFTFFYFPFTFFRFFRAWLGSHNWKPLE